MSNYEIPVVLKEDGSAAANLTLLSAENKEGVKIWYNDFIFENKLRRLVVKQDCSEVAIVTFKTVDPKEKESQSSFVKFQGRSGTDKEGNPSVFFVANFKDLSIAVFLNESSYFDATDPSKSWMCPYFARVKFSEYKGGEAEKKVIDVDFNDVF